MSNRSDLHTRTKLTNCLLPNAVTLKTDTNCASVPLKGFRSCFFTVHMGNSGDVLAAGLFWEIIIEDSDDDTTFAPVTVAADVQGNVEDLTLGLAHLINAPAEDSRIFEVQYTGTKKFVRLAINSTGTHTNGTPISVIGMAAGSSHIPV